MISTVSWSATKRLYSPVLWCNFPAVRRQRPAHSLFISPLWSVWMVVLCARHTVALSKCVTPPSTHRLHVVSYVPWHIQRASGDHRTLSACWIHYIHKLIGGLSVFGLAVQHIASCHVRWSNVSVYYGLNTHLCLPAPMMWCIMWALLCRRDDLSFSFAQHLLKAKICKSHPWSMLKYKLQQWILKGAAAKLNVDVGAVLKSYITVFYRQFM